MESESPRKTEVSDLCRECMLLRLAWADAMAVDEVPTLLTTAGEPDLSVLSAVIDRRRLTEFEASANAADASFFGELEFAGFC